MDTETGLYYLRARYMNPATATFTSMDSYAGNIYDPASLHRYLYANANPVKYTDPSGHSPLVSLTTSVRCLVMKDVTKILCTMERCYKNLVYNGCYEWSHKHGTEGVKAGLQ